MEKTVVKNKVVVSFETIEKAHGIPAGSAKMMFDINTSLKKEEDYIQAGRKIYLTLPGYVELVDAFSGTEGFKAARKSILDVCFGNSTDQNGDPFDIIRKQLDVLEKKLNAPDTKEEEKKEQEKDRKMAAAKKNLAQTKEINKRINDSDAQAWIGGVQKKIKETAKENGSNFTTVLNSVYRKMKQEYGFNAEQSADEFMKHYHLDIKPSILRVIAGDETLREMFETSLEDIKGSGTNAHN